MYIVIVCSLLLFILSFYTRDSILTFISKITLPKKFNNYKTLSEAPLISKNYELVKICSETNKNACNCLSHISNIFYDLHEKKHYLKGGNANEHIYWKLNNQGDIIDSIFVSNSRLFNSGIFFYNNYYLDWINSGDKTKKKYIEIIDDTSLTIEQIRNYIDRAIIVDAGVDYKNSSIEVFTYNGIGWSVLKSNKLYLEIINPDKKNYESESIKLYKIKDSETFSIKVESTNKHFQKRFVNLTNNITDYIKKDEFNNYEVEAFKKTKRKRNPIYSSNSYGYSGWYGIGYLSFYNESESITFQLDIIKHEKHNFSTGINFFYPSIDINQNLRFVNISTKRNRETPLDYFGLYVIRKRH